MFSIQSRLLTALGYGFTLVRVIFSRRMGVSIIFLFLTSVVSLALYVMVFRVGTHSHKIAQANSAYVGTVTSVAVVLVLFALGVIHFLLRQTCDKEGSIHALLWRFIRPLFFKEYDPFGEAHGDVPNTPTFPRRILKLLRK